MKLVASDLDGTLLGPGGTLSERTVRVLRRAADAGVVVVLVTARPPRTVRQLADQIQAKGLAICANGASIYDLDADAIVKHTACEPEIVAGLVRRLREAAPGVRFAVELGHEHGCEPHFVTWNPAVWAGSPTVEDVLALCTGLVSTPVTKLIAHHPELELEGAADDRLGI